MDKKLIAAKIDEFVGRYEYEEMLDRASEAIFAAHEADKAELTAQVAEMAKLLRHAQGCFDDIHEGYSPPSMYPIGLVKAIDKALASAPQVLYADTFKAKELDQCVRLNSRTGDAELRTTDGAFEDGCIYDVIILAGPEQERNSNEHTE